MIDSYQNISNGNLRQLINELSHKETLAHIISGDIEEIRTDDKALLNSYIGDKKAYPTFKALSNSFKTLQEYYKISKMIQFKAIILGWDRKTERFFIKEKLKNESQDQKFLEFLKQLPFLLAIC